jgi:predicted nucleotidyltransferase
MAFIIIGGNVVSFAEYSDVTQTDQRLFEANEGIADSTTVEDLTEKATSRILQLIRNTSWWRRYYLIEADDAQRTATTTRSTPDVPLPNPNLILGRQADFTDLCVYFTLFQYLLPKVADFTQQDTAEANKIGVYRTKYDELFRELIEDGTWYDFNADGVITELEKLPTRVNLVRVR